MDASLPKADLATLLRVAVEAADPKSTVPVLQHIYLRAASGRLHAVGTDLYTTVRLSAPADVAQEGAMLVPLLFVKYAAAMPEGRSCLRLNGSSQALLSSPDFPRKFQIGAMSAAEWPTLQEVPAEAPSHVFPIATLLLVLQTVLPTCSTDETKTANRLLLRWTRAQVEGVSTDGHRLTRLVRLADLESCGEVILQRDSGRVLKALLEQGLKSEVKDCQVRLGNGSAAVRVADMELTVRTQDSYVPYEQVVPSGWTTRAVVDRATMLFALKAVSVQESRQLRMQFDGDKVHLSDQRSEATDEVAIEDASKPNWKAKPFRIDVAPQYLRDVLSSMDDEKVTLSFARDLEPLVVTPGALGVDLPIEVKHLALIMPMKS